MIYFLIAIAGWFLYFILKKKPVERNSSEIKTTIVKESKQTINSAGHKADVSQRTICHLAGAPYYMGGKNNEHLAIFKSGQILVAVREPKNHHDINAIGLFLNTKQVGHIPKMYNEKHSVHMDKGGKLNIKILRVDYDDPWKGVTLDIYND